MNDDDPVPLLLAINTVDDIVGEFDSEISDVCETEEEIEAKRVL